MGPLVGREYFEKELIFQRVTYKKSYFLGIMQKFPSVSQRTRLFSRLIPSLSKLNIKWSAVAMFIFKDTPRLSVFK